MTTTSVDAKTLESRFLLQNYKRFPVVFDRGEGMRLFDVSGRSYLDFLSGIGVNSLGHAHPALVAALSEQVASLSHTSNLYFHSLQGELAARLVALTGLDRAFFCNSGTEAIEGCLKFARRYWHTKGTPGFLALLSRPNDGGRLGNVGRTLSISVRAARSGSAVGQNRRPC